MKDWTQPPTVDAPGDLGPLLAGATLVTLENDRAERTVALRFRLPDDAGTPGARLTAREATHLLAFAYLPPAEPLAPGLAPEEAMAVVGDWARRGLVSTFDPRSAGTPLVVARASLHVAEGGSTLIVEGYGEDPDAIVWWEIRVGGAAVEATGE